MEKRTALIGVRGMSVYGALSAVPTEMLSRSARTKQPSTPLPVPLSFDKSMPLSRATRRANGEMKTRFPEAAGRTAAGFGEAATAVGAVGGGGGAGAAGAAGGGGGAEAGV